MALDPARVRALFLEASNLASAAERAAYLDRVCGSEPEVRVRVEALLAAQDRAGLVLKTGTIGVGEPDSPETMPGAHTVAPETQDMSGSPAPETRSPTELATAEQRPDGTQNMVEKIPPADRPEGSVAGRVIAGRYTLVDVLGEGGMGTVYRAEQTQPVKRQVALKLIRVGMDSRAVLARFDAERQALALMDHPNIARVFDGGTTQGDQPFFVMELVQGYARYRTTINFAVNDLRHTLDRSIYAKNIQDEFGRQVMQFVDKVSQADSDGINQRAKLTLMLHETDSLRSRPDADVETVRQRYAQAIALAESIHRNETQDFDLAAMNRSVAYSKLADFEMSNRQYARAFEGYSRSLAIAKRVLRSPRTKEYTETTRKGFVGRSLDSLAWVTYHLGKRVEAIELFNRSLTLYAEVMASRRDEENLSKVAEIHLRMATLHQHNKAERLALEHFEKAASIHRELVSLEPKNQAYKLDLSKILDSLGDAQFFLGRPDEAKKSYDESLALTRELSVPEELLAVKRTLSLMLYKSATAALRLGKRSESQKLYDECLAIREKYSHAKPRDLDASIEWMLALARCGRIEEARTKAENLLKGAESQKGGNRSAAIFQLQSAFALAIAADNLDRIHPLESSPSERLAERKKLIDRSFQALNLAIASGFDDHYQLETDPDIDALRGDPRFAVILEKLRMRSKAS